MSELRAGAAEIEITPPAVGTWLLGPMAPSTGVHDPLFARALVLDDGETLVALATMDLVGLDFGLVDRIRDGMSRTAGIAPEQLMLNCSHTHSAPFTIPWSVLGWQHFVEKEAAWAEELVRKVGEVVTMAVDALIPARACFGREPVQIGANRRLLTESGVAMEPNPDGPVVPWVDVLRLHGTSGAPMAIVMSHAAHPVIVHGSSTLISADYPGYAVGTVRERFGDKVIVMFAQGCGADINGNPLRGGFGAAQKAGKELGQAAIHAAEKGQSISSNRLSVSSQVAELPLGPPPPEVDCRSMLGEAESRLREHSDPSKTNEKELWNAREAVMRQRELLELAREGDIGRALPFQAQAFSLGDEFCLLGLTHEPFAEYQLWADRVSDFAHTMALGYTNGCESYLPTKQALSLGGYEGSRTGAALSYWNRLRLAPECEEMVKRNLLPLLQ